MASLPEGADYTGELIKAQASAPWTRLSMYTRVMHLQRALDQLELGSPFAFSLNLSPAQAESAFDGDKGFTSFIYQRIGRELNKSFGEGAWALYAVAELKPKDQRPHLHGSFVVNGLRDARDPTCRAMRSALRNAGGDWGEGKDGRQFQVKVKPIYDGLGWARYISKDLHRYANDERLRGLPVAANKKLLDDARQHYDSIWSQFIDAFPARMARLQAAHVGEGLVIAFCVSGELLGALTQLGFGGPARRCSPARPDPRDEHRCVSLKSPNSQGTQELCRARRVKFCRAPAPRARRFRETPPGLTGFPKRHQHPTGSAVARSQHGPGWGTW